jgi:hypothetical protein
LHGTFITYRVKNPSPSQISLFGEGPGFGLHKGAAQGSRYRAHGKNNNRKTIFSLRLAPYALCLLHEGQVVAHRQKRSNHFWENAADP